MTFALEFHFCRYILIDYSQRCLFLDCFFPQSLFVCLKNIKKETQCLWKLSLHKQKSNPCWIFHLSLACFPIPTCLVNLIDTRSKSNISKHFKHDNVESEIHKSNVFQCSRQYYLKHLPPKKSDMPIRKMTKNLDNILFTLVQLFFRSQIVISIFERCLLTVNMIKIPVRSWWISRDLRKTGFAKATGASFSHQLHSKSNWNILIHFVHTLIYHFIQYILPCPPVLWILHK